MLVDRKRSDADLTQLANRPQAIKALRQVGLLKPDETLLRFANGGSESLVFYVTTAAGSTFVRKASSAGLSAARWPARPRGVMSDPFERSRLQVEYLRSIPPSVAALFPSIYNVEQIDLDGALGCGTTLVTDYEYIRGISMSSIVNQDIALPEHIDHLYARLALVLATQVHTVAPMHRRELAVEAYHLTKIEARLQLVRDSWAWAATHLHQNASAVTVNDQPYMSVEQCIAVIRADASMMRALEAPAYNLVVGDSNTQNILICGDPRHLRDVAGPDSVPLRFIDPRGIGPARNQGVVVDDPVYDWKYWHNTVGHYDAMFSGNFWMSVETASSSLHFQLGHRRPPAVEMSSRRLAAAFRSVVAHAAPPGVALSDRYGEHWELRFLFLMGSHFAAMTPFHLNRSHQLSPIGDHNSWMSSSATLAMYCESARWLNACILYWYGEQTLDDILTTQFWR